VVELPYAAGSKLRVGVDAYELLQFHFHAPSKHTVDGKSAAGELHRVHRNVKGELAVVDVLLKVGYPASRLIDDVIRSLLLTAGPPDHRRPAPA
jgi:carbonic anhydrase